MRFYNPFHPPPAPPGFGIGKTVPQVSASFLNQLVVLWLGPFLEVGFSRPLEKEDLWELPQSRLTANTTDALEAVYYPRCPPEVRPRAYREESNESVAETASVESVKEKKGDSSKEESPKKPRFWQRKPKPKYDSSLFAAVHRTFFRRIWTGGILKLIADTLRTTTPLLTKVLLTWLTESYIVHRATDAQKASGLLPKPQGIGYGMGLAVALFAMQEVSSIMTNHSQQAMETVGLSVRTGIIGSVFRKSLRLSARARVEHTVGQTTTIISTDSVRLDRFCMFGHNIWTSPIQIIIGVGLLINNLGYSALVGLGVLLLGFPLQIALVKIMFTQRKKGVKITDTRVRLSNEVLQGIRLIKYYAWESFYTHQIGTLREREIATVRVSAIARAALIALVTLIPVLASILSFITYALSGHDLNIAIIFSSLQFFNIIRMPLVFIPFVLSALSDAIVAFGRIGAFLTAEELPDPYAIDFERKNAVDVDASFAWETAGEIGEPKFATGAGGGGGRGGKGSGRGGKGGGGRGGATKKEKRKEKPKKGAKGGELPTTNEKTASGATTPREEEKPFELRNLKFSVPKGAFVAIVGKVGSGKSSILQGLIGEMRRTAGTVVFGGTMSYVPQTAWIRNATLRQNIIFGQEENEEKFRQVIRACNLEHDLDVLPHREETEIGERGINVSGGQKARISLARAAYSDTDIVLLDDPLSAVDSFVGKAILEDCILHGPLASRTRILVTHALHVLDKTDYIYVMDNGTIKEQGTYETLMKEGVVFSKLMEEYGSLDAEESASAGKGEKAAIVADDQAEIDVKKDQAALMQTEERNTGAVTFETYGKYLKHAGGLIWAPIILLLLTLTQAAQVGNNLFLGFWTSSSIHGFRQGDYMAVYAGLGLAQAFFSFLTSFAFALASLMASLSLFKTALAHVLRSPSSFFDTTPMGRILSRLVKDQDTLDNQLSMTLMQLLTTFASVIGTVGLVFYTFPLLGIIFAPMMVLYYLVSIYYRRSSVETKRLDSLMRSALYASYTETLTGLSTIRAYREQEPAIQSAEQGLDLENRAYFMTITLQLWLGLRLDLFGNLLILGIGLFAAGFRNTVDPSKIGVVLSYTLSITQVFSQMVAFFAQNEQNMNSVERLVTYAELPAEGAATTPEDPPSSWPDRGEIAFKNVEMSYREGLPLVLKGVSFNMRPGEKVGIVGRTGAGKSSLLQALFRMVELQSGEITIDGYNIRNVGLDVLRGRLALVPQDSVLFLGTLRENLDPQASKTDAELISVLQRAWLLPRDGDPPDPTADSKFSLDSTIGDEGSNYSAGEKQLLALCRALVKNSPIIVLDEATSSVDVETDAKLQRTIRTEFAASTLLCIAHRLNTIAYYDRILVMDQGEVAEFDTVLNLFDKEDSIFRSLCNEANLQRADILRIRADNGIETKL
ncbi:multidrug resistance-associated ABC transporter [Mycena albidolilacea]|uniref:Multidrug resistance-associated ABC transporter n=1 Tax=Mycena albidolilacea TaxID=1033008 RepID=A0AAD7A9S8_9AGAR|nr:multidrug resistance-associated ABC transporter [Mycena albidolilacea]